jgi:hypothetical protein
VSCLEIFDGDVVASVIAILTPWVVVSSTCFCLLG